MDFLGFTNCFDRFYNKEFTHVYPHRWQIYGFVDSDVKAYTSLVRPGMMLQCLWC